MAKEIFIHEEVIYVFNEKFYIPTIDFFPLNLSRVRIIGLMVYGKTRNDYFLENSWVKN